MWLFFELKFPFVENKLMNVIICTNWTEIILLSSSLSSKEFKEILFPNCMIQNMLLFWIIHTGWLVTKKAQESFRKVGGSYIQFRLMPKWNVQEMIGGWDFSVRGILLQYIWNKQRPTFLKKILGFLHFSPGFEKLV